jgi:hypothetical protein
MTFEFIPILDAPKMSWAATATISFAFHRNDILFSSIPRILNGLVRYTDKIMKPPYNGFFKYTNLFIT